MPREYGRNNRDHLSPRGAAKLFQVNFKTILRWIQDGQLSSYTLPGGSNRISKDDILNFVFEYDMPLPLGFEDFNHGVLVLTENEKIMDEIWDLVDPDDFTLFPAYTGFEGGTFLATEEPNIVILDAGGKLVKSATLKAVHAHFKKMPQYMNTKLIIIGPSFSRSMVLHLEQYEAYDLIEYKDINKKLPPLLAKMKG